VRKERARVAKRAKKRAKKPHWSDVLDAMGACEEAQRWARRHKTPQAAWKALSYYSWAVWVINSMLPATDNWYASVLAAMGRPDECWLVGALLDEFCDGLGKKSVTYLKSAFPVPTLADLKRAAAGDPPWELIRVSR
jgi:hypothetical protein